MSPTWILDQIAKEWEVIKQIPISFTFICVLSFVLTYLLNKWLYREQFKQRDDLITAYREKLALLGDKEAASKLKQKEEATPRLSAVFKEVPPYAEYAPLHHKPDAPIFYSTIRIGISHNSPHTISNVQARVEKLTFESDDPTAYELPLRLMHDKPPYKQMFSVDAGQTQFVDVAAIGYPEGCIQIRHVMESEIMSFIPLKPYELKINVTGHNAQPCSIRMKLSLTDDGVLKAKVLSDNVSRFKRKAKRLKLVGL
jgi:hypothetical protein